MNYLDTQGIKKAFATHLMEHRDYSTEEAEYAVSDFPDPYRLPYLFEKYVCTETVDGKEYEKYASYTDFTMCGFIDFPMFRYYTYYLADDIPNSIVGEYMNARKLYQVDDLDDEDFPKVAMDDEEFDEDDF